MNRHTLHITLDSDAVFTAKGASVGRPETHERLPGATLLGAAAARAYSALTPAAQLAAFHTGDIRFGDGLPLDPHDQVGLPTPLSWHRPKDGDRVVDLSQADHPEGQQKQLRGGWVSRSATGGWSRWHVATTNSMRTAIDEGGRAREGLLFGFEAVRAGARYRCTIDGDDAALTARLVHDLTSGPPLRLGRSRGAEFGRATARPASPEALEVVDAPRRGLVRVLCLSDLALIDGQTGMPRLIPVPSDIGLPDGWSWQPSRSFLRFHQYSPFNGTRVRPDRERQVITAGSVLTFVHASASASLAELRRHTESGIGEHREAGLGQVAVEPAVLADPEPHVVDQTWDAPKAASAPAPSDELLVWARARAASVAAEQSVWEAAERQAAEVAHWRISRAQWGVVRSLASECLAQPAPLAELDRRWKGIFEDGKAADTWKNRSNKLRDWLGELPSKNVGPAEVVRALQLLATRVPRHQKGGTRE